MDGLNKRGNHRGGNPIHGMCKTRLYHCWKSMNERCWPSSPKRKYYAEKGITICEEWKNPAVFCKWALDNGYGDDLTLDRIDNNGNYEPQNCRWVTQKQQVRNRSTNIRVELNGETRCLQEWGELFGLKWATLYKRWRNGDRGEYLFRKVADIHE